MKVYLVTKFVSRHGKRKTFVAFGLLSRIQKSKK